MSSPHERHVQGGLYQEYLRAMLIEAASRAAVEDVIARARRRVETTGSRVDGAGSSPPATPTGGELAGRL